MPLLCCGQCSRCTPGVAYRSPFSSTGACVPCPSSPRLALGFYLAVSAVVGLLVYTLRVKGVSVAAVVVVVEFLQILSVIGSVEVRFLSVLPSCGDNVE